MTPVITLSITTDSHGRPIATMDGERISHGAHTAIGDRQHTVMWDEERGEITLFRTAP
jgi:hypothetical protein